jgi:NACHT domain
VRDIKATLNESNKRLLDIEDQNQEQHKRLEERHSELKEDLSKVNCAVDGLHRIERNMLDVAEQDRHLSKLSYADGSAYNCYSRQHDPQCLPGTRVDLLNQLVDWGNSPLGKCMFWLNGMAGTGKSTIARTVASTFDSQKRLGGSFFFSRGRGDLSHASKFFSTIAVQLANTTPILKRYICDAIAEHGDISQQTLHNQWSKLILRPLSMLESSLLSPTIIILVVDALDECECQDDIRVILCLFAEAKNLKTARLRIFVTSRPEIQIRLGFGALPGVVHDDIVLHNIAQSIVKQDISVFLKHELEKIREEHALSRDWPGEQTIKVLVERADGLFIYVATICRFVGDPKWLPEERLPLVLQGDSDGQAPTRKLDEMYFQVLRHSVTGDCDEREKPTLSNRFRQVVGTIVTLFESLSVAALTELLAVSARMALVTLNPLSSVLDIPKHQDHPIRLVHPSFRDFLLDKQRCLDDQFWIDERRVHTDLAEHSLRLMSNALRRNGCNLPTPGALSSEVDRNTVDIYLPVHLQYACQYWVGHTQRGNVHICDNGQIHGFLQSHFLHWLEALSLMGKISEGVLMVMNLESVLTVSNAERYTAIPILNYLISSLQNNPIYSPLYMMQDGLF